MRCRPITSTSTSGQAVEALLAGKAVLLSPPFRGPGATAIAIASWPVRSPTEANAEVVLQGPHDGLVEVLTHNVALVRHRIPEPNPRWEWLLVGTRSRMQGPWSMSRE